MKYYLAYGSNLNAPQMRLRCPGAEIFGLGRIDGYELLFKGSKTGSYLTIEKSEGSEVPVVVWAIKDTDEANLDRYEGYPRFYYKKAFRIKVKTIITGRQRTINAFAYIMHEERPAGVPTPFYMETCYEGYDTFGFDKDILDRAYIKSLEVSNHG